MRVGLILFLLLASVVGNLRAQTAGIAMPQDKMPEASAPADSGTPQKKETADRTQASTNAQSPVRPEDAVITLHGVCASSAGGTEKKDQSCATVVSRREFEFLVSSINLGGKPMSMGARQNLAKTYAEYLVYEQPAEKAGLEKSERYAEIMRWLRLRMLTDLMRGKIAEEYRAPSDAEVDRYYQENVAEFERVHIVRIMIPRNVPPSAEPKPAGEKEKQQRDAKLVAAANEARQRAIKGDDAEQIQKELYNALEIGAPPPTDLGKQGRKDFPTEESAELFSLKAGDVSRVEKELASYVIYKVIDRETLPENALKEQISREISRRNIEKANQAITEAVQPEYNERYFGPPLPEVLGKSPHQ